MNSYNIHHIIHAFLKTYRAYTKATTRSMLIIEARETDMKDVKSQQ